MINKQEIQKAIIQCGKMRGGWLYVSRYEIRIEKNFDAFLVTPPSTPGGFCGYVSSKSATPSGKLADYILSRL